VFEKRKFDGLREFGEKSLNAADYPGDTHIFEMFECDYCGIVPLQITLQYHEGYQKGDFKGVITGRCSQCGKEKEFLRYTGENSKMIAEETPVCPCGSMFFYAAMTERFEGDDPLTGFFDEGAVIGECPLCGLKRNFVFTD